MQFKVPQNIDMQDKILGPLTLFQLLYLLIGFLISYSLLRSGSTVMFALIGAPVGLLALALAFIKINDQPFSRFLVSLGMFIIKPKTRVWHRGQAAPRVSVARSALGKTNTKVVRKQLDASRLAQVVSKLDQ